MKRFCLRILSPLPLLECRRSPLAGAFQALFVPQRVCRRAGLRGCTRYRRAGEVSSRVASDEAHEAASTSPAPGI